MIEHHEMNLERYRKSFEDHVISFEEEADARLQSFRQRCVRNFINRLTNRHTQWDTTFRELLRKSQEETPELRNVTFAEKPSICIIDNQQPPANVKAFNEEVSRDVTDASFVADSTITQDTLKDTTPASADASPAKPLITEVKQPDEPFPPDAQDYFTNSLAVQEFIRIHEQQEKTRQILHDLNTNSSLKSFKNELTLFIRTQINSISNSDFKHINSKTQLLTKLFSGQTIEFQDRYISVSKHPQGQLLAMDLAAQTFVTVGTRLVNSVPAIAKSMANVINGIVKNDFPAFRDLVIGHIQERCPFLVPMYPELSDFGTDLDSQIKYMITCGRLQDMKTKSLESEEKYLARMRSMTLIYTCVLVQQDDKGPAWSWLVSFLSLRPQPVITATVLQAFLQESSRSLKQVFGRQYIKLLNFIKTEYIKMIENVTKQPGERQSLIKLINQLDDS